MIVIPGATSANNRMARGLADVDPNIDVQVMEGVGVRADIVCDSADFVKSDHQGALFNDVSLRIRGRVKSVMVPSTDGYEGQPTKFVFSEPKAIDSDADDVIEHSSVADARPNPSLNTDMPQVTLFQRLSPQELYVLGAKGGHLGSYTDEANGAISTILAGRTIENIPLTATLVDAGVVRLIDIEHPHDSMFTRENSGYDFVQMLPVALEMQNNPERVVDTEKDKQTSFESISREAIINEELVDLDDELDDEQTQTEPEATPVEETEFSETPAEMASYVGPQGYDAEGHLADLDEDYASVRDILAEIRGEAVPSREHEAAPASQEAKAESVPQHLSREDEDGRQNIFEDDDFSSRNIFEDDDITEDQPSEDKHDDVFATLDLSFDDVDEPDIFSANEDSEEHHDEDREAHGRDAKMDMANDGASTISEAQLNAPSDPRFADEFADFDL